MVVFLLKLIFTFSISGVFIPFDISVWPIFRTPLFLSTWICLISVPSLHHFQLPSHVFLSANFLGVFRGFTNKLCLLLAIGESLSVTDSTPISAAVHEDMTVVILLSVTWEGQGTCKKHKSINTHMHTPTHTLANKLLAEVESTLQWLSHEWM